MKQWKFFVVLLSLLVLFTGCGKPAQEAEQESTQSETAAQPQQPVEEEPEQPTVQHVVAIDPGHQAAANTDTEPIGPGASEQKAKVTGGTAGAASGLAEYELNLQISLKLQEELTDRGYIVYLTRQTNDVDLSNADRAQYAAEVGAEVFVRIHANGSEDASVSGAMTICQSPDNPYQNVYADSQRLSACVLDAYVAATGIAKQYVWETDTMAGINWCTVPSTILEMGYMTNAEEDLKMADEAFQRTMAAGIADGIDQYFAQSS